MQLLQTMRKADQKAQLVSEKSVNALGHELIDRKLYPQALAVLNLNTQNFPKSANTWDSLAEAFFRNLSTTTCKNDRGGSQGDNPGGIASSAPGEATMVSLTRHPKQARSLTAMA